MKNEWPKQPDLDCFDTYEYAHQILLSARRALEDCQDSERRQLVILRAIKNMRLEGRDDDSAEIVEQFLVEGCFDHPDREWAIYWVETDDHREDWFVAALSEQDACTYHEQYEQYMPGTARATKICLIPADWLAVREWAKTSHPADEEMEACGFKLAQHSSLTARIIEREGQYWVEGNGVLDRLTQEDDNTERDGGGRPNGTKPVTIN